MHQTKSHRIKVRVIKKTSLICSCRKVCFRHAPGQQLKKYYEDHKTCFRCIIYTNMEIVIHTYQIIN